MTHDRLRMTDDRFRPQVMAAERALDELEDHAADRLGVARRAIQALDRKATDTLQEENRRLTADLERTEAELERVKAELDLARGVLYHPDMEAAIHKRDSVPRVIDPKDTQVGQLIFVTWETGWYLGRIQEDIIDVLATEGRRNGDDQVTCMLLQDAPAERPSPVKVGDTISTVKELDGLADGSVVLDYVDDAHQKADGVWWEAARREERDAAGMLAYGPFTVLYLPEEETA